jgi:hypothetical protein
VALIGTYPRCLSAWVGSGKPLRVTLRRLRGLPYDSPVSEDSFLTDEAGCWGAPVVRGGKSLTDTQQKCRHALRVCTAPLGDLLIVIHSAQQSCSTRSRLLKNHLKLPSKRFIGGACVQPMPAWCCPHSVVQLHVLAVFNHVPKPSFVLNFNGSFCIPGAQQSSSNEQLMLF